MKESIATWADLLGSLFFALGFIALTVETVAEGKALKAAISSPFMIFMIAACAFTWAKHFKYIT